MPSSRASTVVRRRRRRRKARSPRRRRSARWPRPRSGSGRAVSDTEVGSMEATQHFSAADAARILQTTESRIVALAELGGVVPSVGPGGAPEFTFQQLLLL